LATGIGSPVIIDSSTLLLPSMITPSMGTFARAHAQHVAFLNFVHGDFLFLAISNSVRSFAQTQQCLIAWPCGFALEPRSIVPAGSGL
jgi:hypothetical protein